MTSRQQENLPMISIFFSRLARFAATALFVAIPLTCAASELPVVFYANGDLVPDAQELVDRILPEDLIHAASAAGLIVYAQPQWFEKLNSCFVEVGLTRMAASSRTPRSPNQFSWRMSHKADNEQESRPSCRRAFVSALESMGGIDAASAMVKSAVEWTTERSTKPMPGGPADPLRIAHATFGLMNDAGKKLIADTVPARDLAVFDYRKYQVQVKLMTGTSLEGRSFCVTVAGLTARAPSDRNPHVPTHVFLNGVLLDDKVGNCSRDSVEGALTQLADTEWPEKLVGQFGYVAEAGVKYPSAKELRTALDAYDRKSAARASRSAGADNRSLRSVTCRNECFNGACTRTFSDGRRERWQAPRVFDPFTNDWKWDTTTNACGG